jgi:hypothetical protein
MRSRRKRQPMSRIAGTKSRKPQVSVTKPGRQQQDAGDHDHDAMDQFAAGHLVGLQRAADALHHAEALDPQQDRAGHGRRQDEAERRQHADLAADQDEDGDLGQGHGQQQKGMKENLTRFDRLEGGEGFTEWAG